MEENQTLTEAEKKKLKDIMLFLKAGVVEHQDFEEFNQALTEKWVDPTPNLIEGIFYVPQNGVCDKCCKKKAKKKADKIYVYDYRSLYCLHFENSVRKKLVNFASSQMFENLIILLIFLNSLILALYNYDDRDNLTEWN